MTLAKSNDPQQTLNMKEALVGKGWKCRCELGSSTYSVHWEEPALAELLKPEVRILMRCHSYDVANKNFDSCFGNWSTAVHYARSEDMSSCLDPRAELCPMNLMSLETGQRAGGAEIPFWPLASSGV